MRSEDFVINAGPNGTFRPSGSYQTTPQHVDAILERFEQDTVTDITLYFHGGLVGEKSGMATAHKMAEHIAGIGHSPLCVVWESGLVETVAGNFKKITETKIFDKIVKVLLKKVSQKLGVNIDGTRGAGGFTTAEIEAQLYTESPFENYASQHDVSIGARSAAASLETQDDTLLLQTLEAEFTYEIAGDAELNAARLETTVAVQEAEISGVQSRGILSSVAFAKQLATIAFKVIKRFIAKRDHNLYPTIIEEVLRALYIADLGAWIWNGMKVKSESMWGDNTNRNGLDRFAGGYVLDKLMAYAQANPEVKINLIGHSAGSIAICNLLKTTAVRFPDFSFHKIAFMAPACRVDLFHEEVVKHPNRFQKFRMYTMTDELETQDRMIPYFYTHSLLYLVSGILEEGGNAIDSYILGLQRHLLKTPPYDSAAELVAAHEFLFEANQDRIVFSPSAADAPEGFRSQSRSHGGFDDDQETVQSILSFLNS